MKKVSTVLIIFVAVLGIVALLLIPGEEHLLDDGGSRFRKSALRMEAEWFYYTPSGGQTVSRVYWFPETLKSVTELKNEAHQYLVSRFEATVLEINDTSVLVELDAHYAQYYGSDKISFGIADLEELAVQVGARVEVTFDGEIMESYPAQIKATGWKLVE